MFQKASSVETSHQCSFTTYPVKRGRPPQLDVSSILGNADVIGYSLTPKLLLNIQKLNIC